MHFQHSILGTQVIAASFYPNLPANSSVLFDLTLVKHYDLCSHVGGACKLIFTPDGGV